MTARANGLGAIVLAACVAIVLARAWTAAPPQAPRKATPKERADVASIIAQNELTWHQQSEEAFPSDAWSESDDFHAREGNRLRELKTDMKLPYEELLRAIDDDIHEHSGQNDLREPHAVPCKPRPFYD